MSFVQDFKAFALKGNVVDLAVAVVIGGAFGKIVTAFVNDLVMPLVNAMMPEGDWRKWEATSLHFKIGDLMGTLIDFVIVALVLFVVLVKFMGAVTKKPAVVEAAPTTRKCPDCLDEVPLAAKRCRSCTSMLPAAA